MNNFHRTNESFFSRKNCYFYVSNRGNITATDLNIAAVDNFYNRGNITADNFQIKEQKVFFSSMKIFFCWHIRWRKYFYLARF